MKIGLRKLIGCVVALGIALSVYSQAIQETPETMRLTLKEAQEYALQHNKTVQNSGLAVTEAQKKVWEAASAGLPQVNATLDYQNMLGFKMELFGQSIALEPTSSLQVQVTQLLFNGSYWIGLRMSRLGKNIAETSKLQSELDIKQQAQTAYLSILVAEENKKILEMNLENINTLAKTTADMVKAGVAEQTDADQMRVQAGAVMNGIKSIERAIEMAYNLMRFHLGVDMNTEIILTETLNDLMNSGSAEETLTTAFDVNANYNMQLIDKQIELANSQVRLQQASTLPTVAMFYNYTHKLKASTFDMSPNNIIGIQASIPIFASGQRYSKIQQAKIQRESAQNNRELVSNQLLMQEKQLRFSLNNAIETMNLQKETLEVSQRVFDSVTRKYSQGVASSLDVTTANTGLLQAQSNYTTAMMDVINAKTELEKLLNAL
ncbi:MAG: TolC family protein [Cytophagaceae bacterium]|jgi:outer membrane protein TolC|nr:TolC family protein [Cytophagaceae bacterium]